MNENENSIRRWLNREYLKRKERNIAYSWRAFARSLKMSSATLSQIMTGTRPVSLKMANRLAAGLKLSPFEQREFFSALSSEGKTVSYTDVEEKMFQTISDWHHYAILALSKVPEAKADASWIAQRLGIPRHEAKAALLRLQSLELIKIDKLGKYRQTSKPMHVKSEAGSRAIQKYHQQNLKHAEKCLSELTPKERYFGSLTVACDPEQLPDIQNMLNQYLKDMDACLERQRYKRVYTLALQFFPVSQ